MPFREKMAAFTRFISEMLAHDHPSAVDNTFFTGSVDLQQDPEIKRIRDAAQERMSSLLLTWVREGREAGEIHPQVSDEALRIYFRAFMDVFTDSHLQRRFYNNTELAEELGRLMLYGLSGHPDHNQGG